MAEDSIKIEETKRVIQGIPQSKGRPADDGKVKVNEVHASFDEFVLDPNSDLAVQIPEGVGASTVDDEFGLVAALRAGTAEDQFAAGDEAPASERLPIRKADEQAPEPKRSKSK